MHNNWLEQLGEVELIGGWAAVVLGEEFAARIDPGAYQVLVTAYEPVQVFVQNRGPRAFELHALPGLDSPRRVSARCGYRVLGHLANSLNNPQPGL